jgi:hypothetical protein
MPGKLRIMLLTREPLFLRGSNYPTGLQQRGGTIMVV